MPSVTKVGAKYDHLQPVAEDKDSSPDIINISLQIYLILQSHQTFQIHPHQINDKNHWPIFQYALAHPICLKTRKYKLS